MKFSNIILLNKTIFLVMNIISINCSPKNAQILDRNPDKMFDFVERAIQLSLEVDSLLGIGLRLHPLEAFRQQNGKIEVYLSMNRLFYWIIEAQKYINGGWIYGGIIPDIEHKIREKSRIMAIFYGHRHSSSPASSSASAFSNKNLRKNYADDEKSVQNWEHNKIGFDAQERQVMREILAVFKVSATKVSEPFRDLLFYIYFNYKLLSILNGIGNVPKYLNGTQQKMAKHLQRHIYTYKWLNWVTKYAERWLTKLISVAVRIGTLNIDNFHATLAECIFRHFEKKSSGHFDETYEVKNSNFLVALRQQKIFDQMATKSEEIQQQFLDKIVGTSLALCNILINFWDVAKNDLQFEFYKDEKGNSLASIFSKTLLHPLRIHDVQAEHHKLVQHLVTLVVFYKHIFELQRVEAVEGRLQCHVENIEQHRGWQFEWH
uniref:Uncharacterized protein n=1 Tax=Globodera rostochiensis TaxID=31243 RepID=A0A914I1K6_GLORO